MTNDKSSIGSLHLLQPGGGGGGGGGGVAEYCKIFHIPFPSVISKKNNNNKKIIIIIK